MGARKPIFLFVDLNSYFAATEQQANPALRGKPVGVCEHSGGIILAASREAKLLGIKTGTPTWEARRICPEIVLLPVDPSKIRALTSRFYRIAEDYSDQVEHVSVDEVSINLTGVSFSYEDAVSIALEIKKRIKQKMGEWITASIGISESRLLSKIGTNLQKPDGLVVIKDEGDQNDYFPAKVFKKLELYNILGLEDIPGIGPRLGKSLRAKGINSLKQLSQVSPSRLRHWYGINGLWLHDLGNFRDAWKDIDLDHRGVKSIGHQYALGKRKALYQKSKIEGLFWKLAEKVTARLRKQDLVASQVGVYISYVNHASIGGSHRVQDFFDDTPSVVKVAGRWLSQINPRLGVTYVAVTVAGLSARPEQGFLFEKDRSKKEIPKVLDKINKRFGDWTVKYAPTMEVEEAAGDTVGFGRTRERRDWQEE